MRILLILLSISILLSCTGCDENGAVPSDGILSGVVVEDPAGGAARDAEVLLMPAFVWPYDGKIVPPLEYFARTPVTPGGLYEFRDVPWGTYVLRAERRDASGRLQAVSAESEAFVFGEPPGRREDVLRLRRVARAGIVTGRVVMGEPAVAAAGSRVELRRRVERRREVVAETVADGEGRFRLEGVATGDYDLRAVWTDDPRGEIAMSTHVAPWAFHDGAGELDRGEIAVTARSGSSMGLIFLDRAEAGRVQVEYDLDERLRLQHAYPGFEDHWDVEVDGSGLIDGRYDYLVSAMQTTIEDEFDIWPEQGWCFAYDDLAEGLDAILEELGLTEDERADFVNSSRGGRSGEYCELRYLAGDDLDAVAGIEVTPPPLSLHRAWFLSIFLDEMVTIEEPVLEPVERAADAVVDLGMFWTDIPIALPADGS